MIRTWAIIERDLRRFRRSPTLIIMSVFMPFIQLIVLGYAFGGQVKNLRLGVVDQDHGQPALKLREMFQAVAANARTFQTTNYSDPAAAMQDLRAGRINGVLALLSIMLARVPCIDDPEVTWHEVVAAAPFLRGGRRLFHDVCDPFLQVAVLPYRYAITPTNEGFQITANLRPTRWRNHLTPESLTAAIRGRGAVAAINGTTCGGRPIQVSLIRYEPGGEA